MPLIDAWTNTFKSLGSRTTGQKAQKYFLTYNDYKGDIPEGYTNIECPSSMVWITGRIQANNEEDALEVNKLQDKYVLEPYSVKLGKGNPLASYDPVFKFAKVRRPVPFSLAMKANEFYNTFF